MATQPSGKLQTRRVIITLSLFAGGGTLWVLNNQGHLKFIPNLLSQTLAVICVLLGTFSNTPSGQALQKLIADVFSQLLSSFFYKNPSQSANSLQSIEPNILQVPSLQSPVTSQASGSKVDYCCVLRDPPHINSKQYLERIVIVKQMYEKIENDEINAVAITGVARVGKTILVPLFITMQKSNVLLAKDLLSQRLFG